MKSSIIAIVVSFVVSMVLCVTLLIPFLKKHDPVYQKATTPVPTVTVTKTVTPTPSASSTPVEEKTPDTLKYGQTYQYPAGLKVTVVGYKSYPKDPTIKMGHKYYKIFTVRVKNTSKTTWPHVEEWYVESAGGEQTDTEGNGIPGGRLASGHTLAFTVVFGYDDTDAPSLTFATCPDTVYLCEPHTWA